jgi:SAM-dependent methyltransferase
MDLTHPYGRLQRRWRGARMRHFAETFGITPDTRVLDVGGTLWNWQFVPELPRLTILNVTPSPEVAEGVTWIVGDGCSLPFDDGAFDIVFSNSVIEHLGSFERQRDFAREVRRVGRRYYVQTPNRWFPFEPHLLTPLVHYLPRAWQRPLYPYTFWALLSRPSRAEIDANFEQIRLLTRQQFGTLFPDATLITERLALMPKCFVARSPAAPA